MKRLLLALFCLSALTTCAPAQEWKPALAPLMTRWAADVKPDKVLPEYPRPQMTRDDWLNLNGVWQLSLGKDRDEAPLGRDLPERILVPFPVESALSGVMKRAERLWYRRTFTVPEGWAGKRTLLHFGAVDWEASVWVNGVKLGTHQGGYDSFSFDITDALKKRPEGSKEHELVVGVFDPTDAGKQPRGKQVRKPGGIYYTPVTGIWQTVWLEPVPEAHIEGLQIAPDLDRGTVRVTARTRGTKEGDTVAVTVFEGGRIFAVAGRPDVPVEVKLESKKPWSPESPHLYDFSVTLSHEKKPTDKVTSYFGLRKVEVVRAEGKAPRIHLNGKEVFQVGLLDQGFWPDGIYTAPTDEALKFDIEAHRKLGFNMTRKHVKVEPARWYYWCDRLGLLVWQDMPSGEASIGPKDADLLRSPESARQFELELGRMIEQHANHPCIVGWVVFNEGWGQYDTKRMAEWTKKLDPTRLVDSASGWTERGLGDVHDIHVYPGPSAPKGDGRRAAVLGEFGGLGLGVDGHTWAKKTWGYQGTRSKEDLTRRYEKLLRRVHELREKEGLCMAVYTQLTDVETEANGLWTYDRAVLKVDEERVAAVNRGDFSKVPVAEVLVADGRRRATNWRYTLEKPAEGWFKPDFDDSGWKKGHGGFGTVGTPGAVVWTRWNTKEIWIRREFDLPKGPWGDIFLLIHHDEDAEVYINGVLAARLPGYTTQYEEVPLSAEATKALKEGKNTLAISCKQTTGGQYIDAGLVTYRAKK